mgnify:CR=1 FL=1
MRASNEDVRTVLEIANGERKAHRLHRNGYTNDRGRTMRKISSIPFEYFVHPEYRKYFDPEMDKHEAKKNHLLFLKKMKAEGKDFTSVDRV